jgi:hypothetical protein
MGPGNARRCQWSGLLKKVLYFAVAVMALPRLDDVFYGGHAHDLVATVVLRCCSPAACWTNVRSACATGRLRPRQHHRGVRHRAGAGLVPAGMEGVRAGARRRGMGQCPTRRLPCPQC